MWRLVLVLALAACPRQKAADTVVELISGAAVDGSVQVAAGGVAVVREAG